MIAFFMRKPGADLQGIAIHANAEAVDVVDEILDFHLSLSISSSKRRSKSEVG